MQKRHVGFSYMGVMLNLGQQCIIPLLDVFVTLAQLLGSNVTEEALVQK